MNISGMIFDLDGTLANTADLHNGRRSPWDVLAISDSRGRNALNFKYKGVDVGLGQVIAELLQHGIPVGVVTRSPSSYASTLLWILGYDFLAFRAGGDGITQEERIKSLCSELEIDISSAIYIGDSEDDREAAKSAGCHFASPFWNPRSITANDLWGKWAEVTPTFYPSDISPTMRHLVSVFFGSEPIIPEYKLDVVVARILKDCISLTDIMWLETTQYKYWDVLAKQKVNWPTPRMPGDIEPEDGNWQDGVFERMEGVLKSGDWARMLTLKPQKAAWYLKKFPESVEQVRSRANYSEAIVNESIISAYMSAGLLPKKPHEGILTVPLIVQWAQSHVGNYENNLILESSSKRESIPEYGGIRNVFKLQIPHSQKQSLGMHYSLISQVDEEFEYWLEETQILLRNRYDFDQLFLRQLLSHVCELIRPTNVTKGYFHLPSVSQSGKSIRAFLPYRSENTPNGQDFWLPIKNWGKGWQSGPEVHLHYLEQIALVMSAYISFVDPAGERPLMGIPSHPPTSEKPAAASMRLVKRIGEILSREVHWPLVREADEFHVKDGLHLNNYRNGILIDDQLTSGKTYQRACDTLGFSTDLLVWSSSSFSGGTSSS